MDLDSNVFLSHAMVMIMIIICGLIHFPSDCAKNALVRLFYHYTILRLAKIPVFLTIRVAWPVQLFPGQPGTGCGGTRLPGVSTDL